MINLPRCIVLPPGVAKKCQIKKFKDKTNLIDKDISDLKYLKCGRVKGAPRYGRRQEATIGKKFGVLLKFLGHSVRNLGI